MKWAQLVRGAPFFEPVLFQFGKIASTVYSNFQVQIKGERKLPEVKDDCGLSNHSSSHKHGRRAKEEQEKSALSLGMQKTDNADEAKKVEDYYSPKPSPGPRKPTSAEFVCPDRKLYSATDENPGECVPNPKGNIAQFDPASALPECTKEARQTSRADCESEPESETHERQCKWINYGGQLTLSFAVRPTDVRYVAMERSGRDLKDLKYLIENPTQQAHYFVGKHESTVPKLKVWKKMSELSDSSYIDDGDVRKDAGKHPFKHAYKATSAASVPVRGVCVPVGRENKDHRKLCDTVQILTDSSGEGDAETRCTSVRPSSGGSEICRWIQGFEKNVLHHLTIQQQEELRSCTPTIIGKCEPLVGVNNPLNKDADYCSKLTSDEVYIDPHQEQLSCEWMSLTKDVSINHFDSKILTTEEERKKWTEFLQKSDKYDSGKEVKRQDVFRNNSADAPTIDEYAHNVKADGFVHDDLKKAVGEKLLLQRDKFGIKQLQIKTGCKFSARSDLNKPGCEFRQEQAAK